MEHLPVPLYVPVSWMISKMHRIQQKDSPPSAAQSARSRPSYCCSTRLHTPSSHILPINFLVQTVSRNRVFCRSPSRLEYHYSISGTECDIDIGIRLWLWKRLLWLLLRARLKSLRLQRDANRKKSEMSSRSCSRSQICSEVIYFASENVFVGPPKEYQHWCS